MRLRGKGDFKTKRVSHHDCEKHAQEKAFERRDLRRREKSGQEALERRSLFRKKELLRLFELPVII